MILCRATQYSQELLTDVGIDCSDFDLFQQLDLIVTPQAMGGLLTAQWGVYAVILAYAWTRYAIKMAKF